MAVEKENSSIILDIFTSRDLVQLQVLYGMENVRKNELVFGKVNKTGNYFNIDFIFSHFSRSIFMASNFDGYSSKYYYSYPDQSNMKILVHVPIYIYRHT